MAPTLTSLRRTSLMPVLAVLSSFFLITGQILNCCRLNETFSESVGKVARAVAHLVSHHEPDPEIQTAETHPGCHGHSPSGESRSNAARQDQTGNNLKAEETCLSEIGFTPNALKPSGDFQAALFVSTPVFLQEIIVPRLPRIEKPRPQNKSSPPIYLLTLRILV